MHTPLPPPSLDHDLHHVADDIFRRMDYSPGPINTDDVKEKHDHHHEQKKAFASLLSGFFQKLAMGVPPPLPAAARALGGAAKQVAKPGTAAILAGAGTGFRQAPALNPFKAAAVYRPAKLNKVEKLIERAEPYGKAMGAAGMAAGAGYLAQSAYKAHKARKEKHAADLTSAARAKLPGSDFAVKAKKSNTGKEAYPISDEQHARSALGFAKMHGDAADLAAVRKKIQAKYPDMLKSAQYHSFFTKTAGSLIERMKGLGTELATSAPMQHKAELAGLGVLAAPVGYELQKNVREGHTGDAISNTAELGGLGVLAAPAVAALRHH